MAREQPFFNRPSGPPLAASRACGLTWQSFYRSDSAAPDPSGRSFVVEEM
jgi:hypothetical protein